MQFGPRPEIWLITGIPGAGKSTVARALAERLGRGAHIEGDALAAWVIGGRVLPGDPPADEADRQVELCIRNQCLLARSFAEAGVTPVIDYVIPNAYRLDAYRRYLAGGRLRLVVLAPPVAVALRRDRARATKQVAERRADLDREQRETLAAAGLWIDSGDLDVDATVDAALAGRDAALLSG